MPTIKRPPTCTLALLFVVVVFFASAFVVVVVAPAVCGARKKRRQRQRRRIGTNTRQTTRLLARRAVRLCGAACCSNQNAGALLPPAPPALPNRPCGGGVQRPAAFQIAMCVFGVQKTPGVRLKTVGQKTVVMRAGEKRSRREKQEMCGGKYTLLAARVRVSRGV